RHGLVEHDVLAGFKCGESDGSMQVIGQRDGNDIDLGAGNDVAIVGGDEGDVEHLRSIARAAGGGVGDGGEAHGRVLLEGAEVIETDGAGAEDGDVESSFFSHETGCGGLGGEDSDQP